MIEEVVVLAVDPGASEGAAAAMIHPLPQRDVQQNIIHTVEWTGTPKLRMETGSMGPAIKAFREMAAVVLPIAKERCRGRVLLRIEGVYYSPDKGPKAMLGPALVGGLWLSMAFPAHTYQMPNASFWRQYFGWKGGTAACKASAMAFGELLLGRPVSSHLGEALAMCTVPAAMMMAPPNPRKRKARRSRKEEITVETLRQRGFKL
jgi:hypothetical protein